MYSNRSTLKNIVHCSPFCPRKRLWGGIINFMPLSSSLFANSWNCDSCKTNPKCGTGTSSKDYSRTKNKCPRNNTQWTHWPLQRTYHHRLDCKNQDNGIFLQHSDKLFGDPRENSLATCAQIYVLLQVLKCRRRTNKGEDYFF